MSDKVLDLLRDLAAGQRELVVEIRALRAAIEDGRGARAPVSAVAAADLLRAIHEYAGHKAFLTRELVEHAQLPPEGRLYAAITAAIGELNAQSLGLHLRSINGRDLGGLTLNRLGKDKGAGAALWSVGGTPGP